VTDCLLLCLVPPTIDGNKVENVEVIENHTTYLMCNVHGIPPPTVMWFRDNVPLFDVPYTNLRELNGGQQLELRNVRSSDEAVYKCQANNVAGQQSKSFKLRILSMFIQFIYLVYTVCILFFSS